MQGLHHAWLGLALTNAGAKTIINAIGNHGPAVIKPRAHHIDLITALRPMLMRPQLTRSGVKGGALHVAVTKGPFFGHGIDTFGEGIVERHAAVVMQANDRPRVVIQFLGALLITPVTQSQIQHAGFVEHNASAKMLARTCFGLHAEQDLDLGHTRSLQFASSQSCAPTSRPRRVVSPVNPAVLRMLRVQDHIEQTALSCRYHIGQACNGFRIQPQILAHQAQAPSPFGHQHPPVGQKSHRPGVFQSFQQGNYAKRVLFGIDHRGAVLRQGRR